MATITAGNSFSDRLEAGRILNLTLAAGSQALLTLSSAHGLSRQTALTANTSVGPFAASQSYKVECIAGTVDTAKSARDQQTLGQNVITVSSSRAINGGDFDQVLSVANGVTLTLPTDATLGINDASAAPAIALYPAGAGYTLDTSAVTMRGTAPTVAQYVTTGIMRVGPNEWAFV